MCVWSMIFSWRIHNHYFKIGTLIQSHCKEGKQQKKNQLLVTRVRYFVQNVVFRELEQTYIHCVHQIQKVTCIETKRNSNVQ